MEIDLVFVIRVGYRPSLFPPGNKLGRPFTRSLWTRRRLAATPIHLKSSRESRDDVVSWRLNFALSLADMF